jgi:ABC-type sulfate/molybdate transport systems ATPase subunit
MLCLRSLTAEAPRIGPVDATFADHTVIVGPSGAGKTTLFRALLGLSKCGGDITLGTEVVTRAGRALVVGPRRGMAMAWQDGRLLPHLTLLENAALGTSEEAARPWLELLEITGLAGKLPHQVSGGEAQRANLARAFASGCPLLLLDEPFHGVDLLTVRKLLAPVLEKLTAQKRLVLMVTHDLAGNVGAFRRMLVMKAGAVVAHGDTDALYSSPDTAWLAGFLGDYSVLNEAEARLLGAAPDGKGPVFVRPEWLEVEAREGAKANATVVQSLWNGATQRAQVRVDGREEPVPVETVQPARLTQGERIHVVIRKSTRPVWLEPAGEPAGVGSGSPRGVG